MPLQLLNFLSLKVLKVSNDKISILMPVKNAAEYLKDCLDSILAQTFEDWELIAVDDGSSDKSKSILEAYADDESRISVFSNNGKGIIPALRLAFAKSTGKFITRMDADDIMHNEKLELLRARLVNHEVGHIAVGLVTYFSDSHLGDGYKKYAAWLNKLTEREANFDDIYMECTIPSPCWMVHRSDLNKCGGFQSDIYPEDYDLAFRFRKQKLKVKAVRREIHKWRDYPARSSRTDENYSDNRFSPLKVYHFIEQDRQEDMPLMLWGAGKKGKLLAKLFLERDQDFTWVCNNKNKIGHAIYGVTLKGINTLKTAEPAQVVVAVSTFYKGQDIIRIFSQENQHTYFRFF
jgi:glycosyltransferase involved in cell wall biosynthesis